MKNQIKVSKMFSIAMLLTVPFKAMSSNYQIWMNSPASGGMNGQQTWIQQTLPIGNGRLGGTIYGSVPAERVLLNESSVWEGGTTSGGTGKFLPFVELDAEMTIPGNGYSNYRRDLDIGDALAHVNFTQNNVNYKREFFASFPDSVLVVHLSANVAGSISGKIYLTPQLGGTVTANGNLLVHNLEVASNADIPAMHYEVQVYVKNYAGTLSVDGSGIKIMNADSVDLIVAAATDFGKGTTPTSWRAGGNPHTKASKHIADAITKTYVQLKNAHMMDYKNLFDRFSLDLNDSVNKNIPTPERRGAYRADDGKDRGLDVLLTQYGRYLAIASSHGYLPSNLQGLWNQMPNPPWRSDYHSDINVQMNQWHLEPLNLSECVTPFINFVNNQRDIRKVRTKEIFPTIPNLRGWTVEFETNHMGGGSWGVNTAGSAWYCNILWEHFRFTQDTTYLRNTALPILKEIVQYWQDRMIMSNGQLMSPDGNSPENQGGGGPGIAYDQQLIWDLFHNYSKAEEICKVDLGYKKSVDSMIAILHPGLRKGSKGDLLEWAQEAQGEGGHRHLSHLVGLYPGSQIAPLVNTEWAKAAQLALEMRGDGSTGWSAAWRADCWSRLLDGNKAYHQLGLLVKNFMFDNLWDNCNNEYQIDGNFGFASAVAEMLIQSQSGVLHLLPALPTAWPSGTVKGLKARGNYTVDMNWSSGTLVSAVVKPSNNGLCQIRTSKKYPITLNGAAVPTTYSHSDSVAEFQAMAGSAYVVGTPGILPLRLTQRKNLELNNLSPNANTTSYSLLGRKNASANRQAKKVNVFVIDNTNKNGVNGNILMNRNSDEK